MNKIFIKSSAYADGVKGLNQFFDQMRLRRIDALSKMALYAAAKTLYEIGIDLNKEKSDIGLIIATGRGPVKQTCDFMNSIIDDGDTLASPLAFSQSVHNSIETSITILLNLRGPCLTISQGGDSFASAVVTAKSWLLSEKCKHVLLGAADEEHPVISKEYENKILKKKCAAFFLLTLEETSNELVAEDIKSDDFNPSLYPFELARKTCVFITKDATQRILEDFVKAALAEKKKDIMSVFANKNIPELMQNLDIDEKQNIFDGITTLFSIDNDKVADTGTINETCFESARKHNKINFSTSGSTGDPQNCVHTKDMVKEEVEGVAFLFKNIERVINTVLSHHSYGFIFALQMPRCLDLPVLSYPPVPVLEWTKTLKEGDLLVTFPLFLKYLTKFDFKFPQGVTILVSTAPCPDELMENLYRNGAQRVIEIYGASEAGAIGFRENPGAPFFLLPFWDYKEEDGLVKSISRKTTSLRKNLPDIAKVKGERLFSVIERIDNAVQVAGVNVFPSKVEKTLKQHPMVKDAVVRLGKERLKAFIVLQKGVNEKNAKTILYNYMETIFTVHEIPKNLTFGNKLPLTAFGKKANW
ncbi:MAG: beta-ketoacyl synthase chain length factor [Endomicrobia bacterium]|nr:beta-ketoacyl synthase chain length factor [Endomicrobiia bacterium]MCL2799303.1 beta-ketoacyl synthase chain length factor [Endomicrobiia bacterium]